MRKALVNVEIINSKRQPHSIDQILTRARFISIDNSEESDIQAKQKCGSDKCGLCPILQEHNEIKFKNDDKKFEIQSEMDYTIAIGDAICLIKCGGCDKECIGETSNL